MCLMIHVAADQVLCPPYAPEVGGLIVRALPPAAASAFRAFSKPHVHAISFEDACGCEFSHPDDRPRQGLVWLLQWALRFVPAVELFVCGEGLEGSEPTRSDWASAAELRVWQAFCGGEFFVIHRDTEADTAPAKGGFGC
jgi:hypothetical protein